MSNVSKQPSLEKTKEVVRDNPGEDPSCVLEAYKEHLTPYERTEIERYQRVYYTGVTAEKINPPSEGPVHNHGFDDEKGCYNIVLHDHIAYRYEILRVLGKGSFGQVVRAFDHKKNIHVAVKVVRNEPRFHRQVREEVRLLDVLRKLDKNNNHNVVHMLDAFTFRSHPVIIFELHSFNLFELIKKNRFQGFQLYLVRKFGRSILQCLDLLHRNRIIHCDLKPENVLLREAGRTGIKVIDFGSSCYEDKTIYTYIQSRFYRAPEIILGLKYGMPIDMWSFGCILAELHTGVPIFPGESEGDQIALMMELRGKPSDQLLLMSKRRKHFFTEDLIPRYCTLKVNADGKKVLVGGTSKRGRPRGPPGSKDLEKALKSDDPAFLDFIDQCLQWNPADRLTPSEALKHPWMQSSQSAPARKASAEKIKSVQKKIQGGPAPHARKKSGAKASDSLAGYAKEKLKGEPAGKVRTLRQDSLAQSKHRRIRTAPAEDVLSKLTLDPSQVREMKAMFQERKKRAKPTGSDSQSSLDQGGEAKGIDEQAPAPVQTNAGPNAVTAGKD